MEMELTYLLLLYASLSFLSLLFAFNLIRPSLPLRKNLPPSPPSLPIIGHLHLLRKPIHRNLQSLSAKYGPVMFLRLGSRPAVVVSSSSAVEECFTKNDVVLANRPRLLLGKHLGYNYTDMAAAPYGDHWLNLRRIGAVEIFSVSRINKFADIRRDEVERSVRKLSRNSIDRFSKVEMQSALSELTLNVSMRMAAGKRYYGEEVTNEEEARRFRELIKEILALGGVSNLGDFLPILNWIIPNGFERKLIQLGKKMDAFLQGLIDDHRRKKEEGRNTMIDHLLSLQESDPVQYDDRIIKGFILVLLTAGTDTSVVTMEWVLSHLLNNPEVLKKARDELDTQIGEERLVEEQDMSKLPYLHGIISETLRLTPAAPMLLPHCAANDCTIGGYNVPRDTMVLVNAWAIHRDPKEWEEPTSFRPERYEKSEVEVHKLVAFGVGRRACPGSAMAQRVMGLTLAALIQCFEWERIIGEEQVDMNEGTGATMPKIVPLEAMCKPRPIVKNFFFTQK